MTWLRSPSGDCFHCGQPYSLHDSCTDKCPIDSPRERTSLSLDGAAPLAAGDEPAAFSPDDIHRETLIGYCQSIVNDSARSRDLRRAAFALWRELHFERSERVIRRMEWDQGIGRAIA